MKYILILSLLIISIPSVVFSEQKKSKEELSPEHVASFCKAYHLELNDRAKEALEIFLRLSTLYPESSEISLRLAVCYENLQKFDLSKENYIKACERGVKYKQPYLRLVDFHIQKDEFQQAHTVLDKLLKVLGPFEGPDWIDYNLSRGKVYESQDQYDKARQHYNICLKEDPLEYRVHYRMAYMSEETKNYLDAAKHYSAVRELLFENADVHQMIVYCYFKGGNNDKALEEAESFFDKYPNNKECMSIAYVVSDALKSERKYKKAIEILRKIYRRFGKEFGSEPYETTADLNYIVGDLKDMSLTMLDAMKADCESAKLWNKFDALARETRTSRSIVFYDYLISKKPKMIQPYMKLTVLYIVINSTDNALETIEKATKAGMSEELAFYLRGVVYFSVKNYNEAANNFEKSLAKNPKDETTVIRLCQSYENLGKLDKSIELAKSTIEKHNDFIKLTAFLGQSYLENDKNLEEATDLFKKCVDSDPENSKYHVLLGRTYFKRNILDESVKSVQTSIKKDEKNSSAWELLGDIFTKNKDKDSAIKAYQRSLQINPDSPEVQEKLDELQK